MPEFTGRSAEDGPERKDLHAHVFPGGHSEMIKQVAKVTAWAYPSKKAGRNSVNLKASVENVGSGHFMPTGLPGLRQMWVEVLVRDSQGKEVFANKSPIGIQALDNDGHPTMPWNAVRFGEDTRIGPQKKRQWNWTVQLPENSPGPLDVKVSVFYRLVSEVAAKAAGISPAPAQEIASDHLKIYSDGRIDKASLN